MRTGPPTGRHQNGPQMELLHKGWNLGDQHLGQDKKGRTEKLENQIKEMYVGVNIKSNLVLGISIQKCESVNIYTS